MRDTWLSPRALGLHVTLAVVIPGFLWLGWWQLHRALAGNGLSWAYTVEWPFFCVYATVMWWRLVHDVARDRAARATTAGTDTARPPANAPTAVDPGDAELAAYNSYLASLHDPRRTGRR